MKLFLDSANIREIKDANATGLIEGVTTDPTLIAKEGRGFEETVREICAIVDGPVAVEAVSQGWEELVEEGRTLARLHRNVVVKVPLTADGLRAVRRLAHDGVKTDVTLCFSPVQALLAAKAGATYVSPGIGKIDDLGEHGGDVIEKTLSIYNNYDIPTQLLVTSVRTPVHVLEAALVGADCCSMPAHVFQQILKHPLTEAGMRQTVDAWKKVPKN
jgi:transaldolase